MIRNITWILAFMLLPACLAFAQEEEATPDTTKLWTSSGSASLAFSNVGLSNWAGGGENAISVGTILDGKLVRETEKSNWTSTLNIAYGIARVGGSDNLFKKTDDQIILNSNYAYKIDQHWGLAANSEWRTQIAPGYTYAVDADGKEFEDQVISRFFAPGYNINSVGIQYQNKIVTINFAPYSNKFTYVLDDSLSNAGAYGVRPGERVRQEWAAFNFNLKLEFEPFDNATFKSNFNLFGNYETLDRMDVNWETLLVLKVNKYINTSFSTQLIYDHDVLIPQEGGGERRAIQFKHVLNINVGIKF